MILRKIFFNRPIQVVYAIVAMILIPILVPILAIVQNWREIISCYVENYRDALALMAGRIQFRD